MMGICARLSAICSERVPEKCVRFSDKNTLKYLNLEQFLFDWV